MNQNPTVAEVIQHYWEDPSSPYYGLRSASRACYDCYCKTILLWAEDRRLSDIKRDDIKTFGAMHSKQYFMPLRQALKFVDLPEAYRLLGLIIITYERPSLTATRNRLAGRAGRAA